MHVVTGGAYNGKKVWVKETYSSQLTDKSLWFNCYEETWPIHFSFDRSHFMIVIEGIEEALRHFLKREETGSAKEFFHLYVEPLLAWEKADDKRQCVLIGTDITKGLVPMDKEERKWRDETGRLLQLCVSEATDVTIVWFGLAQTIKGGKS